MVLNTSLFHFLVSVKAFKIAVFTENNQPPAKSTLLNSKECQWQGQTKTALHKHGNYSQRKMSLPGTAIRNTSAGLSYIVGEPTPICVTWMFLKSQQQQHINSLLEGIIDLQGKNIQINPQLVGYSASI